MNRFFCYLLISFISFAFVGNTYAKEVKGDIYPDKTLTLYKKKAINIAMFLPLAYDKIEELDFTKFNIEEKKRIKYRCFEYITFYEGARIALEKLEAEGYAVSLYVYDVGEDDINQMKTLLSQPELKTMDLIIPLVFQQSFALVSEFSNANKIPIINPMSSNYSVIENNPYTFKIQPSDIADVETILRYIKNNFPNPNITLVFTPNALPRHDEDVLLEQRVDEDPLVRGRRFREEVERAAWQGVRDARVVEHLRHERAALGVDADVHLAVEAALEDQIGRASCRERV